MMALNKLERQRIIEILTAAFDGNQSVNFIISPHGNSTKRIRGLMDYACRVCENYGEVVLSSDRNACALVLLPHTKKSSLKSVLLDLKLIFQVVGVVNLFKVLRRETLIHQHHPDGPFYYLWFIGVDPAFRGEGRGSVLMEQMIANAESMCIPLYLETSTQENISWYNRFGIRVYHELDLGYRLHLMRRSV